MDGTYGLAAGAVFFLIFVAVAYIAFRLLKRTVKMAVRMAVVAIILVVAVVGGISFLWFGSGASNPARSTPTRSR